MSPLTKVFAENASVLLLQFRKPEIVFYFSSTTKGVGGGYYYLNQKEGECHVSISK